MIFDRHLRKRVALSYRSVAGQLSKVHVLEVYYVRITSFWFEGFGFWGGGQRTFRSSRQTVIMPSLSPPVVTLVPLTFDGQNQCRNWCIRWPNRASDHGLWQPMARYVKWDVKYDRLLCRNNNSTKVWFVVCGCMCSLVSNLNLGPLNTRQLLLARSRIAICAITH
jgi:hypothetical protein